MSQWSLKLWGLDNHRYSLRDSAQAGFIGVAYFLLAFVCIALIDAIGSWDLWHQELVSPFNPHTTLSLVNVLIIGVGLWWAPRHAHRRESGNLLLVVIAVGSFWGVLLSTLLDVGIQGYFAVQYHRLTGQSWVSYLSHFIQWAYPGFVVNGLSLFIVLCVRWRLKAYRHDVKRATQDTSGNLGSARMATASDITRYGLREKTGALLGKDTQSYLRYPELTDRLILAYRGGGKTSSLLVPMLIDYQHVNKFITDIKGELAIITARKAKAAGRDVFIIDPFAVLAQHGLNIETHCVNPLWYLTDCDAAAYDRYISALASALCSSEGAPRTETERHFNENAQIIIEGILDHYVSTHAYHPEQLNLVALHDWWLNVIGDEKERDLKKMRQGSLKARAAAAQLSSAGKDESGSMRTTVYRQLQWLRGEAIRQVFSANEVDLNAFVEGDADIYVVLPEDMIQSYSCMVRVIMGLVRVKLTQSDVRKLKPEYCFVLDECGQFGYCPDIELMINTMRYRGVKVWASFQTLEQIEVYRDQSVFKGMPIKHFLGSG